MIGWLAVAALALAAFAIGALALRMPRDKWMLFAAALVFGLAGYAWQGSPDLPSSPKPAAVKSSQSGEAMVLARHELFSESAIKPNYLVTSDAFARRGRFADAAALLRRGVRENPKDLESWLALGMALTAHAEGNVTPAARHAYDMARAANPDHPGPLFFLGVAYLQSRNFTGARAAWQELLENSPEDAPWRPDLENRLEALDRLIDSAPMLQR